MTMCNVDIQSDKIKKALSVFLLFLFMICFDFQVNSLTIAALNELTYLVILYH